MNNVNGGGLWDPIFGAVLAFVCGLLGRLMYHAREAQAGRRPVLGWHLVLELPVAGGMCAVGMGIASWLALGFWPTVAVVTAISYVGPPFIEWALDLVRARFGSTSGGGGA